jgi:hypothetical protein
MASEALMLQLCRGTRGELPHLESVGLAYFLLERCLYSFHIVPCLSAVLVLQSPAASVFNIYLKS